MTGRLGDSTVPLHEFLAEDFARMDPNLIRRCMKIDGRRVYLSGATGFFGKNILALLSELQRRGASFKVTALSRAPERFLAEQPWCRMQPWLEWRQGDVLEPWPGEGRFDLLLHAATDTAASSHVDKLEVFERILSGTRQALAFAEAHGTRRLLLCGSGAQYGQTTQRHADGVSETESRACDSTRPGSAYGEGKRVSELLCSLHAEKHGFDVVNTRCFAFVGPGLPLDGHFAIGNFMRDALAGRPIRLASSGEAVRSYLYGADLAVWLVVLLLEAAHGAAVNVGSDHAIRIIDLATRVRDLVDPRLAILTGEPCPGEERQFYVPSVGHARSYGLDAWTDLDQAIRRTALWHRAARMESQPLVGTAT
jgi:nucleoside-diphosphate-sugar epimerase